MGNVISRSSLIVFELLNELYIAMGAGVWGIGIVLNHGIRNNRYGGTIFVTAITCTSLLYIFNSHEMEVADKRKVVVISGCDSGLGYSLAHQLTESGFRVLAGCLSLTSEGAKQLQYNEVKIFELDVTNSDSISRAVRQVAKVLDADSENTLWGLINNAGMMVFAEFEWQTERLIYEQINVNLLGTMRLTHAFMPLLRQHKSKIINITSHCASQSLPGLSVYGATKGAIQNFSDSLRVEAGKYGVTVITFIPGSFVTKSNILSRHMEHVFEMRSAFSKEQEHFYSDYFIKYNSYLNSLAIPNPPVKIDEPILYEKMSHALLSRTPYHMYKVEPLRYAIYHKLFALCPVGLRDYLVLQFVQMPDYRPTDSSAYSHGDDDTMSEKEYLRSDFSEKSELMGA